MADQNDLVVIGSDDENETYTGDKNPEVTRPTEQTIDLVNLQQKMKLLQEQLDLYKDNEKNYEAKDKELKSAVETLQALLKKTMDQCGIYESLSEQRRMELDEKEKDIVHLQEENETLKLKIEALNVNYQDGSMIVFNVNDNTELADDYETLQDRMNELNDRFNQLIKSIDSNKHNFKHQLETYAGQDKLREQLEELRAQVRQSKENGDKWFQRASSWEREALKLKASFDEWKSKVEADLSAAQLNESNLNKQVEELKTKIRLTESAMEIKLGEALQHNSDLSSECEQLKLKLQTSEQKHQDFIIQEILKKESNEFLREKGVKTKKRKPE